MASSFSKQGSRDAALTSLRLVYLRRSVPFDLKQNQHDVEDVLVALSATLAFALTKSGSTNIRMRMYISASALRNRRSLFSSFGRAPAESAGDRGFEPHEWLHV